MMTRTIFYVLSTVILVSAAMAVTRRNLFHCALYLVLALFGTAGIFLYLGQEFLAAVQVLIYVGAVTILIIFGLMLTRKVMDEKTRVMNSQVAGALLVSALLTGLALLAVKDVLSSLPAVAADDPGGISAPGVAALGAALLRPDQGFVYAFELLSFLLLAALVGAIVVARKEED
jgi:NADH-quinone oxidoreductase subunit J